MGAKTAGGCVGGGGLLDAALFGALGYISVGFIERCQHLSELFVFLLHLPVVEVV